MKKIIFAFLVCGANCSPFLLAQNAEIKTLNTSDPDLSFTKWRQTSSHKYAGLLSDHKSMILGNVEHVVLYDSAFNQLWTKVPYTSWGSIKLMDLEVGFNNEILTLMYGDDHRAYLIRYDENGVQQLGLEYSVGPSAIFHLAKVLPINTQEYLLLGGYCSLEDFVIKTDTLGNILWSKEYDTQADFSNTFVDGLAVGPDKYCLLADDYMFSLLFIDGNGTLLSKKQYSFTDNKVEILKLVQDAEQNLLVLGTHSKSNYLIKLDSEGELLWAKAIQHPALDKAKDIGILADGSILMTSSLKYASAIGYEGMATWFDSNGNLIWSYRSANPTEGDDFLNGLWTDPSGKVLIGGVSATNGNQLYKIGQFSASQTIFCQADTVDLSVSTVTASFILANSVININDFTPTIRNHLVGSGGWWLDFGTSTFCQSAVDFDADGFALPLDCDDANPAVYPGAADLPNNGIDEDCDGSDLTSATDELPLLQSVQIMPNPMSDQLTIRGDGSLHIGYFLLDGLGRIVLQGKADLTNGGIPIQTGPLPEGIYSLEITDLGSGLSTTRKLIKMAP